MSVRTQLAYAAAGVVLVVGLLSLFAPVLGARLLGIEIVAPRGVSEVRATYGALNLTMAALLLWALPRRPRSGGKVRVMGALWLGAAAGRTLSLVIDGAATLGNLGLLLAQLAVGAALLWAGLETPPSPAEARGRRELAAAQRRLAVARRRAAAGRAPVGQASADAPRDGGEDPA